MLYTKTRLKLWSKCINSVSKIKFIRALFHDELFLLEKELTDCRSVLDIGCGNNSPLQNYTHLTYTVGVEPFEPYVRLSKQRKIHTKYIKSEIQEVRFPENSFDAVILIGVLEHLTYFEGDTLLQQCAKWAKKKIILSTPNGFHPQKSIDDNKYQEHLSGWSVQDLQKAGYKVYGIGGAKFLYKKGLHSYDQKTAKYSYVNFRFHPKPLIFLLNALLELFIYRYPRLAVSLFAVKTINKDS